MHLQLANQFGSPFGAFLLTPWQAISLDMLGSTDPGSGRKRNMVDRRR